MKNSFLQSSIKQFEYYKLLAERAIAQLNNEKLYWQPAPESNSIAVIMNHIAGNMLSRFTDFLTSDGEKPWRNRDNEFEAPAEGHEQLLQKWNDAWQCLINALSSLTEDDLEKIIFIRNDGHTVTEAINRQLAHYPYHVGQIVYIAKMLKDAEWQSLSIPKNKSADYNSRKFSNEKEKRHFTDDL
ncbi:DUF1572 family protein [Mucilaginibacter lutimaris]|uniref:DUF1572 family protein n=1 Tax=Mucilaginibacter lutimaris TaxID=931629 RepID=A0ABW2ZLN3_9SPHI